MLLYRKHGQSVLVHDGVNRGSLVLHFFFQSPTPTPTHTHAHLHPHPHHPNSNPNPNPLPSTPTRWCTPKPTHPAPTPTPCVLSPVLQWWWCLQVCWWGGKGQRGLIALETYHLVLEILTCMHARTLLCTVAHIWQFVYPRIQQSHSPHSQRYEYLPQSRTAGSGAGARVRS